MMEWLDDPIAVAQYRQNQIKILLAILATLGGGALVTYLIVSSRVVG